MNIDYAYCQTNVCLHRVGCKRWLGNYTDKAVKDIMDNERVRYINYKDCIPNYKSVDCTNSYGLLDRFRGSEGSTL